MFKALRIIYPVMLMFRLHNVELCGVAHQKRVAPKGDKKMELQTIKKEVNGKVYTNYYLVVGGVKVRIKPAFDSDYKTLSTLSKVYETKK